MAANRRKQDDKNLEILRELISLNGNKYCLDCNQRGPTYVNTTIGSFVCSKCSGMLRGLTPPHRIKSISMATFTPEEMEFIKARGNDYCRKVWLGLYEGESVKFSDEQSIRDFMSAKYEKKRYYLEASANHLANTNGTTTTKSKSKSSRNGTSTNSVEPATLISISPQNTNKQTSKSVGAPLVSQNSVVNRLLPVNDISHKLSRPQNNLSQSYLSNGLMPQQNVVSTAVPDFPVDFSTANIYNSSQANNNFSNNMFYQQTAVPSFDAFSSPSSTTSSNDRYAALADLDLELRQQNQKVFVPEENNVNNNNNKNPFQSTNSDLFGNKNPFFNGWNGMPAVPVNPFMPTTDSSFGNSNNPFL